MPTLVEVAGKASDGALPLSVLDSIDYSKLDLSRLTFEEKRELLDLLELKRAIAKQNKLRDYRPYPKQRDFHNAGSLEGVFERLLRAGNQVGKTWSAGFETAMHLTGRYPEWWQGKRFNHATQFWVAGVTGETTRDNPQRILLGRVGEWGTGAIPAECIIHIQRKSHGIADSVDYVQVTHASGGISMCAFKAYEQGRDKFQGETLDGIWFDEEPDIEVYSEGKTRTQAGDNGNGGIVYMTFTPLLGMSDVVKRYLVDKEPGTHDTNMTIDDALHYSAERRAQIVAGYLPHEREARSKGIPVLGSGRVYPVVESMITCQPFRIPSHWPRICGIDFGWDHPAAGVWIAWDRDTNTRYVYDCYRQREQTPIFHAAIIRAKGAWIPVAWPHDGMQHGKSDGEELAASYRKHGANMLDKKAWHPEHGNSLEATVGMTLELMQTGSLKVFSHLNEWFEEFRLYHREKGLIVPKNDDILSAMRYGLMSLEEYAALPVPEQSYITSFGVMDPETGY
jgi:phage terminase large subunit-like protein